MTPTLTLTRQVNTSPRAVFASWTEPAELEWYFSPLPGERKPVTLDLRVGGDWRQWMIVGEDTRFFTGGRFLEIDPPNHLRFIWGADDGWPDFDDGLIVDVDLVPSGEQTDMTFTLSFDDHVSDERAAEWFAMGIEQGWSDTIDRLVEKYARE